MIFYSVYVFCTFVNEPLRNVTIVICCFIYTEKLLCKILGEWLIDREMIMGNFLHIIIVRGINPFKVLNNRIFFKCRQAFTMTTTWLHSVCGKCYTYQYLYLPQIAPLIVWWVTPGAKCHGMLLLMQDHILSHCWGVDTSYEPPALPCPPWGGVGHTQWEPGGVEGCI